MKHIEAIDIIIGDLYRHTASVSLADFREWALQQLCLLIPFDAAIWSTGSLSTRTFHTNTLVGLPDNFHEDLLEKLPLNPITKALFNHIGEPIDMRDVVDDKTFYHAPIYTEFFALHGIERVLSSVHIDQRSGIYTLLTLYRKDRQQCFQPEEKAIQKRLLFHLLNAASHACIQHLHMGKEFDTNTLSAICDKHGIYHEVEPAFLDLMDGCFPEHVIQGLPFEIKVDTATQLINGLHVQIQKLGDLYRVDIRHQQPLDQLTERELQVVNGVAGGLSFKVIAKQLGLSPSTVSNHLYRIYNKLDISNRTELADMVNQSYKRSNSDKLVT